MWMGQPLYLNIHISIKMIKAAQQNKREYYLVLPSIGVSIHAQNRIINPIHSSICEPKLINSPEKLPSKVIANRYNSIDFIVINLMIVSSCYHSTVAFFLWKKNIFLHLLFVAVLSDSWGVYPARAVGGV